MNLRTVPAIACKWVQEMYPTILWSWGVLPTCTWKGRNKKMINGRLYTTLLPNPSVQPFSPFFLANSILKTEVDTKVPETQTGASWSYWGLWPAHWPFAHYLVQCFGFDLQHIKKFYFFPFFAVPLFPCPSSHSCVRFRPTTQVRYKTKTNYKLINYIKLYN